MTKLIALLFLLSQAITPPPSAEIWAEPIPFFEQSIEESYLAPASRYGSGHRGIDFHVEPGQSIHSPDHGVVHFVGKVVNRNLITIRTTHGKLASFEPVCSSLRMGDLVRKGQALGVRCLGDESYFAHCDSCVHASARDHHGYLSPLHLMGQMTASVLIS